MATDTLSLEELERQRELDELRESETNIKVRTPIISKHNGNHSGSKTGWGQTIWTKGQPETHVIVAGAEFPWIEKAPYVTSGVSIYGAIEYNKDRDEVKCHECGWWGKAIGPHSWQIHKMPIKQYKLKHGLSVGRGVCTAMVSKAQSARAPRPLFSPTSWTPEMKTRNEEKRQANIESRKSYAALVCRTSQLSPETLNLRGNCQAQRIADIASLSDRLGRTPTNQELSSFVNSHGYKSLSPRNLALLFGVPLRAILTRAGCTPRKSGHFRKETSHVA